MSNVLAGVLALALSVPGIGEIASLPAVGRQTAEVGPLGAMACVAGPDRVPALERAPGIGDSGPAAAELPAAGAIRDLGAADAVLPLPGVAGVDAGTVAAMKDFGRAVPLPFETLLTVMDIWVGGEIGELRMQAYAAAKDGDADRYREQSALFWSRLGAAVERRKAVGGYPEARVMRQSLRR